MRHTNRIGKEIERLKEQKKTQGSHQGEATQRVIDALDWVLSKKDGTPSGMDETAKAAKAAKKAEKKSTRKALKAKAPDTAGKKSTINPVPKGSSKKPDKKAAAKATVPSDKINHTETNTAVNE